LDYFPLFYVNCDKFQDYYYQIFHISNTMLSFRDILHQDVVNPESVTMAGDDFIILDATVLSLSSRFPYQNEWLIATLCEAGTASGTVNLRDYSLGPGGFIIILPGQVVVNSELSPDFKGKTVIMSRLFAESLEIGRTLSLTASITNRPYYQFQQGAIDIVRNYIASCQTMIRQNGDNSSLREILSLLSRAFFLGASPMLTSRDETLPIGPYSKLTEEFLAMVEKDYRSERRLDRYAARLDRSTKYLSRHIKQETGRNATDWIDRCVILDAQARLISTRDSIREISDSLGFPSQSFFGKYFKRVTGMTPKEFRQGKKSPAGKSGGADMA